MFAIMNDAGLERFGADLDHSMIEEIVSWRRDPELGTLYASLQAITDRDKFLNTYAEAIIARHLLANGCEIRVEVLTPAGRSCDFEVIAGSQRFFLHVKRLNTDRPATRRLPVSAHLRYLEQIARPYVVSVRHKEALTGEQIRRYVTAAAQFIKHARVGDEIVIRDDDETELGGCRVIAPWQGSRISLVIGLPSSFHDQGPRIRRLMRKAYRQFMPGKTNVILISSAHVEDLDDIGTALLGSHIERWDAVPPRGRRIAHGRDTDGFWHGQRAPASRATGWFSYRSHAVPVQCRLWFRPDDPLPPPMKETLVDLFDAVGGTITCSGDSGGTNDE